MIGSLRTDGRTWCEQTLWCCELSANMLICDHFNIWAAFSWKSDNRYVFITALVSLIQVLYYGAQISLHFKHVIWKRIDASRWLSVNEETLCSQDVCVPGRGKRWPAAWGGSLWRICPTCRRGRRAARHLRDTTGGYHGNTAQTPREQVQHPKFIPYYILIFLLLGFTNSS